MIEFLSSENWQRKKDETIEIYHARIESQKTTWHNMCKQHGNMYMVKFGEEDTRPMWEDQINVEELVSQLPSPSGRPLDCPLCQPYDTFNYELGKYLVRRFLTKIINPNYPEGFIDKEGVWIKCPCIIKPEKRKYLKFQGMRTT